MNRKIISLRARKILIQSLWCSLRKMSFQIYPVDVCAQALSEAIWKCLLAKPIYTKELVRSSAFRFWLSADDSQLYELMINSVLLNKYESLKWELFYSK